MNSLETKQKQKSQKLMRMAQIMQRNSLGLNFEYFKTYTQVKRRISQKDSKSLLSFLESQRLNHLQFENNNSPPQDSRRKSLIEKVQEIKANQIANQLEEFQYETTREGLKQIIELERQDKLKKMSLKENKIEQKSSQEKTYELFLLGAFICFIFSIVNTIMKEFQKK